MNFFAFAIMSSAWTAFFFAPKSTMSRLFQMLVFGFLAAVMIVAGGFNYWWDSGMRPSKASPFVLICGVLTIASQALIVLIGAADEIGGTPRPERNSKRK